MAEIAPDVDWMRVYHQQGPSPKGSLLRFASKNPPCSGWIGSVLLRGSKRTTLFCPYTFTSNQVRNDCAELETAVEQRPSMKPARLVELMRRKWSEYQNMGMSVDYDTAALVFRKLGAAVPESVLKGGKRDDRVKGGKDAASELTKPVKRDSKRGRFLQYLLENGGNVPVRELMAEFEMTRSNALSYLYMLTKDHGIGYELQGEDAVLNPPECESFFDDGFVVETS